MFFIESSEVCICPECNGELKYRDKAPRIQKQSGGDGLRPMDRQMRRSMKLPENYDEIVAQAIQLKREVPRRSVQRGY